MWRGALESYVRDRGGGDPAVLEELSTLRSPKTLRPAQVVFGALDLPGSRGRVRDLRGLLVGVTEVEGRWWYVFLVGSNDVKRTQSRRVVDLRAVAFSMDDGAMNWRNGERDRAALARYTASREDSDVPLVAFPAPTDSFSLTVESGVATVCDRRSDAMWSVALVDQVESSEAAETDADSNGMDVVNDNVRVIEMVDTHLAADRWHGGK